MPAPKPIDPLVATRFGEVLQSLRAEKGLAQEEVAHRAKLSRNYYQLLEQGLSSRTGRTPANPSLAVLIDLAQAFDTTAERLVAEIFEPHPDVDVEWRGRDGSGGGNGRDGTSFGAHDSRRR
ncbi:Helix-turn-helix domain-containing protein [Micrococcales bacterium KH10]|nr:Helix-turn-helix domain-containing protein [Micrococcales bacterium KH10]